VHPIGTGSKGRAQGGHFKLVKFFVSRGSEGYADAFCSAASIGNKQIVQYIFDAHKAGDKDVVGGPLPVKLAHHDSLERGNKDMANFLLTL